MPDEIRGLSHKVCFTVSDLRDAQLMVSKIAQTRQRVGAFSDRLAEEIERAEQNGKSDVEMEFETGLLSFVRTLIYLGNTSHLISASQLEAISRRLAGAVPKKQPRTTFAQVRQSLDINPGLLAASYESAVYALLCRAGYSPAFLSESGTASKPDIVVEDIGLVIECKDVQGENYSWPLSEHQLTLLAVKVVQGAGQVDSYLPGSCVNRAVFLDLPEGIMPGLMAADAPEVNRFWNSILVGLTVPQCLFATTFECAHHRRMDGKGELPAVRLGLVRAREVDPPGPPWTDELAQRLFVAFGEDLRESVED